ncbi:hypothetical protein JAGODDHD_02967 [Sphingomonas paucimobilis]|nr:hypothetical protein [Sphingomonas paucimobilis]
MAPSAKMMGTSARSSNSSMAKAPRPTGLVVPTKGSTSAVEERVSASPSPIAPANPWPIKCNAPPIRIAEPSNSAAPVPNTSLRIAQSLRKESSNPMENSNNMMPNSAKGSIDSGLEIVR